jgi:hypothetical protein
LEARVMKASGQLARKVRIISGILLSIKVH